LLLKRSKLNLTDYKNLLYLHKVDKSKWRQAITDYQKLEDSIWNSIPKYEDVVVPDSWKKAQYKKRVNRDLTGKAVIYKARFPDRASDNYAAYDKKTLSISELYNARKFVIYGQKSDREELDKIFRLVYRYRRVTVIYTASKNHKYLESMENAIHVDDVKGWNRVFSKTITAYKISLFIAKNNFFFNNIDYISKLNPKYSELLNWLSEYESLYASQRQLNSFFDACWSLAEEHKYYDHEAYAKLTKATKLVEELSDLKFLKRTSAGSYYSRVKSKLDFDTLELAKRIIKPYLNV